MLPHLVPNQVHQNRSRFACRESRNYLTEKNINAAGKLIRFYSRAVQPPILSGFSATRDSAGPQAVSSERATISERSRDGFGAAARRRNAASARSRRTGSSARQERNAVV